MPDDDSTGGRVYAAPPSEPVPINFNNEEDQRRIQRDRTKTAATEANADLLENPKPDRVETLLADLRQRLYEPLQSLGAVGETIYRGSRTTVGLILEVDVLESDYIYLEVNVANAGNVHAYEYSPNGGSSWHSPVGFVITSGTETDETLLTGLTTTSPGVNRYLVPTGGMGRFRVRLTTAAGRTSVDIRVVRGTPLGIVPIRRLSSLFDSVTATGPLTNTELRATPVPVSGPLTDTELRATPVPVSGTLATSPANHTYGTPAQVTVTGVAANLVPATAGYREVTIKVDKSATNGICINPDGAATTAHFVLDPGDTVIMQTAQAISAIRNGSSSPTVYVMVGT